MKGILKGWLSEDGPGGEGKDTPTAEVARLRKEVETYKHAFETTAADRDRLAKAIETHKHAFETTAIDRNKWKSKYENQQSTLDWVLQNAALLTIPPLPPMSGPFPHLVCVGSQKCATSFLYSCIRAHPAITVAPKDSGSVSREHPVAFEVGQIDRADGLERVRSANPDARILVCIREPVERALSEYKMRVRAGRETRSFAEAITANEPGGPFAYIRRSLYASDIERFRNAFANVLVLHAEDDARANLWRLLRFMGMTDRDSLVLAANPLMKYAVSSSSDAQAKRATLSPKQRKLHRVKLTDEERRRLYKVYFEEDQNRLEDMLKIRV